MHDLPRIIAGEPVGKAIAVVILRKSVQQTLSVTIGLLRKPMRPPTTTTRHRRSPTTAPPATATRQSRDAPDSSQDQATVPDTTKPAPDATAPAPVVGPLGLSLDTLSDDTRSRFGIKPDITAGVVITGVAPGSAAEDKRLEPGEVIAMVEDDAVSSPDDFQAKIDALKKDGRVNARLVVRSRDDHVRWVNLAIGDAAPAATPPARGNARRRPEALSRLLLDELVALVALRIEQGGEVAVVDARRRGFRDLRLGAIGDPQSGAADHGKIVGAVADGHRVGDLEARGPASCSPASPASRSARGSAPSPCRSACRR